MKAGWKTVKLSEIALVGAGNSAPQETEDFSEDGPLFVRTSDVGEVKFGTVVSANDRLSPRGAKGMRLWKSGTILIPKSGASTFVNHRVILGTDAHVSSHLATITADTAKADPRFLLYYLITVRAQDLIQDQSYPSLKLPEIGGIEIPLPPLAEQKRIVALLDEAFKGIDEAKAKAEANISEAESLLRSHLNLTFRIPKRDWIETKLGTIGRVSMCKRILKEQTKQTGEIPFYKIGTFGKQPDAYIPSSIYNDFRSKYPFPSKGEILISAAGTIGRRVRYDGEPAYFQDSNIVWIENDEKKVLNNYLYHFYSACEWNSTSGATISRLYNDNLRSIDIVFPASLSEQQEIAVKTDSVVSEVKKLGEAYQQKDAAYSFLKASILSQAFAGELTA